MKTKILYYISPSGKTPVKKFIDSLSNKQQTKVLRVFKYIKEYGLSVPLPQIKKLSNTPFWEIRVLGKDSIRIIYVVPFKNTVLALHGFIKKSQKTPQKELKAALSRHQEWLDR